MASTAAAGSFQYKMAEMLKALDMVDVSKENGLDENWKPPSRFDRHEISASARPENDATSEKRQYASKRMGNSRTSDHSNNDSDNDEMNHEPPDFYGEAMDDEDAEYVTKHLRGQTDLNADTALSCPCCFVTVSYASQRYYYLYMKDST
jgi:hypothetical protein